MNKVETIHYDEDGDVYAIYHYRYDDKDREIERIEYFPNTENVWLYRFVKEYDENGNKNIDIYMLKDGKVYKNDFDCDGPIIPKIIKKCDGKGNYVLF